MSNRHYWPTEDGSRHLVEHKDGRILGGSIFKGLWCVNGEEWTAAMLEERGYLGVLKPFSEEAARAAFEEHFKGKMYFDRDEDGEYIDWHTGFAWLGWLEAKRHERGL